jgi:hypothetical protein
VKFLSLPSDTPGLSDYVTVAGSTQTITSAKTFSAGTLRLLNATRSTVLASAASVSDKTATFPNVNGTVLTCATPSTTATHATFATSNSGEVTQRAVVASDISDLFATDWTPANMRVTGWFKADDGANTVDGATPSKWNDQSGNGNHGTNSGAPAFKTNILNGKPVFRFDGVDDRFDLPNLMSGATAGYALVVCAIDNDPPAADGQTGPPLGDFGTDSGLRDHYTWTSGDVYSDFGSTARKGAGNPSNALTSFHIMEMSSAASDWRLRFNGSAFYSTGTNTVGWGSSPRIGFSTDGGSSCWFDGDIAEIVIVKGVPSQALIDKLVGYAAHKYGLTSVLSAGHPYKTTSPKAPFTGTVSFYAASSSGGTVNVENVVSMTNGVVTAWQQV